MTTMAEPSDFGLSVLIVDDDAAMRRSVRRVLMLDSYEVDVAGSVEEMFDSEKLDQYFAILLDRKLPDGDASQFISRVRDRAPYAAILIVTGHADMDSTLAAIRHGVNDYLIKPVEPATLRSRLASLAELYKTRCELRQSESRMKFLVENLPAGAIYVDHEDLFINRAVERLTGYTADEIGTVHDWFRVLCADRYEACLEKYRRMKEENFRDACLLPIVRRDGLRRELNIAAHQYDHHEVWLVTDVTELQDVERRLVQSERLAAIGQMVTGLAHESRNALQRARGCLDLLELDLESQPEQLNLTSRIRRALGDLQKNYEEVRQYAAPITLDRSEIDIAEAAQSAFDDVRAEFVTHDVEFHVNKKGNCYAKVDAYRISQVFRNAFENAIASANGKVCIDFTVGRETTATGTDLTCVIRDNGHGMDTETQTRIFEPFYTTKQSGTGLGMAICKRIIDAHNGTISAQSVVDHGTEILVRIPLSSTPS